MISADVDVASLPLLRPVFRSFGSFFITIRGTTAPGPSQNYKGTGSAPTYGSVPLKRSNASHPDSDSEVGFADEGSLIAGCDIAGSSKAFVMHDITPRNSELGEKNGIYVRSETKIVHHDADAKI